MPNSSECCLRSPQELKLISRVVSVLESRGTSNFEGPLKLPPEAALFVRSIGLAPIAVFLIERFLDCHWIGIFKA
jgi:hypothetical protein